MYEIIRLDIYNSQLTPKKDRGLEQLAPMLTYEVALGYEKWGHKWPAVPHPLPYLGQLQGGESSSS